jgi:hypothetical protein
MLQALQFAVAVAPMSPLSTAVGASSEHKKIWWSRSQAMLMAHS